MVWWIDNYKTRNITTGVHFRFKLNDDRIFQTGNTMLQLADDIYKADTMSSLVAAGVNIFNVDLTIYDGEYLQKVEEVLSQVENMNMIYPERSRRNITLSVTMSVNNPVKITERTNFVILKDAVDKEKVINFKKINVENSSIPILLWFDKLEMEATNELIKLSDGIILDIGNGIFNCCYRSCIEKCYEVHKPVFYYHPDLVEIYYSRYGNDRKLLGFAEQLVENRFHGVMLNDKKAQSFAPKELIHSLVKAVHIAEMKIDLHKDFQEKCFVVKTPTLPPYAVAYAAAHSAMKCGASAIVVLTSTGRSAKIASFTSPTCPIIAITTRLQTARVLNLYRKVLPLVYLGGRAHSWLDECRNRVVFGTDFAFSVRLISHRAKVVVLAPAEETSGFCDSFQVITAFDGA